jgi:hypothetical protein
MTSVQTSTVLRRAVTTGALTALIIANAGRAEAQNAVLEWNAVAAQLIVVGSQTPVQQTRLMAIVHVAMHDAVSGMTGEYEQYLAAVPGPGATDPNAAAIGAAHRALRSLVGNPALLSTSLAQSLAAYGLSPTDPSVAFGEAVADGIVARRMNDGASLAAFAFTPPGAGAPGVWVPMPGQTSLLPGWGRVTPFVLRTASQFRPDPPPTLDSEQYARDYNEVLLVGAANSATRTADQSQIAQFWRASPTALWNPLLRRALMSRGDDLASTARVMALFYLAASDASVACWEAKYVYNFWRPQAAIVRGNEDGNDATAADPGWMPFITPTQPHPDYVSGHTANSGAMAFVLQSIFGDNPGYVIEATSTTAPGFPRRWQSFSEGVDEVIDARVYSGFHFRTADVAGARLGRQVAKFVLTHALRNSRGQ